MDRNCIGSNQNITIYVFSIISFTCIYIYTLSSHRPNKNIKSKLLQKINKLENDYRELVSKQQSKQERPVTQVAQVPQIPYYPQGSYVPGIPDYVDNRDRNVVNDELYPPITRATSPPSWTR
jgi:hypothetical protein